MHHVNILAGTGDGTAEHLIMQTSLVVWTDEEKLICRDSNSAANHPNVCIPCIFLVCFSPLAISEMNFPLVDRAAVEKGQKYLRAWILRPWSKMLKFQKALTSAFSSSLGTLSVVSLSVKQNRNKNETHAVLSIVTNSS